MWHSAAGPASLRDRLVVAVGAVAALALGGCKSSTAPPQPTGSVALWVAGGGVLGFTGSQLASSTSAAPAVVLSGPGSPDNFAFDAHGDLWVAEGFVVVEYTASQLALGGNPAPTVEITANPGGSVPGSVALTFDAHGDLWVANWNNTLVEFTPRQLAASGTPTPAVTLSANAGSISGPTGVAFDRRGNLWVSNSDVTPSRTVIEFSPSQLAASGSPVPAVTLSDNGSGSLTTPFGLAFDHGGNLWVVNSCHSVVEFASSQLGSTGSPTPAVALTSAGSGGLVCPTGLAFDGQGNLWLSDEMRGDIPGAGGVLEFAVSQLMASGTPTPVVTLSSGAIYTPLGLAFTP